MTAADEEVETLRAAVARHFNVYGTVVTPFALTFQVTPPPGPFDAAFDELRKEIVPKSYIPTITRERGELLVHVQRRPPQRFTTTRANLVMLAVTVVTTVLFGGAWNWSGYTGEDWLSAGSLLWGTVFFSIPLLAILGCHEMGHYVVAKRHNVQASLPFFLPSIPPLGTFGAFISMRDPLPNRRALLDIGASGPLVGFAIAIPVTIAGLFLSAATPRPVLPAGGEFTFIRPSAFYAFLNLFFPLPQNYALHPLAFAGWVGLFVTAINLLPAGQLDGGHIARALLGDRQHYVSWAAILILFVMSYWYAGWIFFGFLILMLGVRHPPPLDDLSPLDGRRKLLGVAAVAILLITFVPQPFVFGSVQHGVAFETLAGQPLSVLNETGTRGTTVLFDFAVNNTGTADERVALSLNPMNLNNAGFTLRFAEVTVGNVTEPVNATAATVDLGGSSRAVVRFSVEIPTSVAVLGSVWEFAILARTVPAGSEATLAVNLTVTS
ncbi:MAG TPA: site-2 protease family protein [Thermoplasmata archaeon]|nr:site-2 protease family protein [Thermoplasmata archaeon]